ncbi:hypothetical protein E2C01_100057 [Portunus trituberculatus]|uniref:Uncharacterized protein n=1 Tax=Portunus trituberculatus TaxID=210409 RepID=A0A5B7K719_PORTR|nr:hypothetical protein [Portunus trituberculatus]
MGPGVGEATRPLRMSPMID